MVSKVSIIILNWNGWKDTIECLESVYQIDYPNYEVIVVDNNSENASITKIKEYCRGKIEVKSEFFEYKPNNKPVSIIEISEEDIKNSNEVKKELSHLNKRLILIKNKSNYGFAKGNNIGIEYAISKLHSDYVLLLNNDTVVKKDFLANLIKTANSQEDFGIFSPLIYEYHNKEKLQYSNDEIKWHTGRIKRRVNEKNLDLLESDTICGASMLIKKETVQLIGQLPEYYFMLWEDIDYSTSANTNNIKCGYVSKSKIWHKGSVSIGKASNPLRIRYSIRNRLIFWKKYSTNFQLYCFIISLLLFHIPALLFVGISKTNQKKKLIRAFYEGFKKGLSFH